MGIKERGSGEPQDEALVHTTPNAEERFTPTVVETSAEEVVAEAESSLTAAPGTTAEVGPVPILLPSPAEVPVPVGAAEITVPTAEWIVTPAQPLPTEETHPELKLGLAALALAGFLSFSRETRRPGVIDNRG